MSINRWMDKVVMVHIHSGILLSYKKRNAFESVLIRWMNLTEWSKSERERQISHRNAYIWNIGEGNGNPLHSCLKNPMDCSLSGSSVHWVTRVGHELVTKPPSPRNLERWYWWTYLQGSNGDTDIEQRVTDTVGEGEGGRIWESSSETYTLPDVKQIANGSLM